MANLPPFRSLLGPWGMASYLAQFTQPAMVEMLEKFRQAAELQSKWQSQDIRFDEEMAAFARSLCLRDGRTVLRACYPSDLCRILLSISLYEGRQPRLTRTDLERAVNLYFARS